MSISKFLIIRNDRKRLLTAFLISTLMLSPALLDITLASLSKSGMNFVFKDTKNSMFQEKSPNTLGDINPQRVKKLISTPNIMVQRSSKVQLFTRANKTLEEITPDLIETEESINEVTNNLSKEQSTESKLIAGAITKPVFRQDFIISPPPNYPLEARKQSVQGTASLKLVIQPSGIVKRVEILESSGSNILDQEAISALSNWIYQSNMGISTDREYQITITFTLDALEMPAFHQTVSPQM